MAVPLPDQGSTVAAGQHGAGLDGTGIGPQPQGAALVDLIALAGHKVDDLVGAIGDELAGVGVSQCGHVAGKLNDRNLHAQADAQIGDLVFPGVPGCQDHALNAPGAEAAGHQDAVQIPQHLGVVLHGHSFRVDPVDVDAGLQRITGVAEGFGYRQIGVVELDIFTH